MGTSRQQDMAPTGQRNKGSRNGEILDVIEDEEPMAGGS